MKDSLDWVSAMQVLGSYEVSRHHLLQQATRAWGFCCRGDAYGPLRSLKMRHTFSKETREGSLGFFSGPRWEVVFFWLIRQPSVLLCFTTAIPQRARRGRPRWACCRGWMLWPSAGTHNASTFPTRWPGAPSKYSEQKEMPKPQSGDSWTTQGSPFCWARNWALNSVTANRG